MCGILAVLNSPEDPDDLRARLVTLAKTVRHRGPDWSGIHTQRNANHNGRTVVNVLAHERLAIVDPSGRAVESHVAAYSRAQEWRPGCRISDSSNTGGRRWTTRDAEELPRNGYGLLCASVVD